LAIVEVEDAVAVLAAYFPNSADNADKQRFVLRHIFATGPAHDAASYPQAGS
jgi:hypothetical protein